MEEKIEKRKFYISDFQEEAEWLSKMQKEGWKFVFTDGRKYRFEACEKEEWSYQLDFKEDGTDEEAYIQMYQDFGWEYVFRFRKWFYFRKKKTEEQEDLSIFSDNESKIDMCRRVSNGQFFSFLPLYVVVLVYNYLVFFTRIFQQNGFFGGLLQGIAIAAVLVSVYGIGVYIGQLSRLNKLISELENPVK